MTIKMTWGDVQECKEISDEIWDQRRWVTSHRLVFEHDAKTYECFPEYPSTEQQDGCGTDDDDELECFEVEPVEKTVIVYQRKV